MPNSNSNERKSQNNLFKITHDPLTKKFTAISFAGCGFMSMYHIGAASAIKNYAYPFFKSCNKIYGCSAGSMIATALLSDYCFGTAYRNAFILAEEIRQKPFGIFDPRFKFRPILERDLQELCPEDIHESASGKIFISLTRFKDGKNVVVSQFDTRKDFIDALICSSFVPWYLGIIPPTFKNTAYIDGGLSDNLPGCSETTIRISPFAGVDSISPTDDHDSRFHLGHVYLANNSFNLSFKNAKRLRMAFMPPSNKTMMELCKQGFYDAYKFLSENGLVYKECPGYNFSSHVPVYVNSQQRRLSRPRVSSVSDAALRTNNVKQNLIETKLRSRKRIRHISQSDMTTNNSEAEIPYELQTAFSDSKLITSKSKRQKLKNLIKFFVLPIFYPLLASINYLCHFIEGLPWLPRIWRFLIRKYYNSILVPKFIRKRIDFLLEILDVFLPYSLDLNILKENNNCSDGEIMETKVISWSPLKRYQ